MIIFLICYEAKCLIYLLILIAGLELLWFKRFFLKKELTHRSHELKALGWNQEDLTRYEDLWDYSQRWGLINLER